MDFSTVDAQSAAVEGIDHRPDAPEMVPGRCLHADADFYAYQCGYRWEEESLEVSIKALRQTIHVARIMAGAEYVKLYLTMGDKGGRYEIAAVKEYQAIRNERAEGLERRVAELRDWMANCPDPECVPVVCLDQEADDALCQAMHIAEHMGTTDLNPMWSMDKDLYMAPGIHMNPTTYELEKFPLGFGECYLDDSTSSKKVVGKGTSFFWHQMLMGDGADSILGLPAFSAEIVEEYWPTKALTTAKARVKQARTTAAATKARATLKKHREKLKPKAAGPVKAFEYLKGIDNDHDAFLLVRAAYYAHYGQGTFEHQHWKGHYREVTAGDMFMEQAELLWMRRTHGESVFTFLKEIVK